MTGVEKAAGKEAEHVVAKAVEGAGVRDAEKVTAKQTAEDVEKKTFGRGGEAVKTTFGTGRPAHVARVRVYREGKVVSDSVERSGNMTDAERALGFPKSTLATHTESRAVRNTPLQSGDHMLIDGQYAPCSPCKGAMNRAKTDTGAEITYRWPDGEWKARGRRR
jgi:hypothetical protein